MPALVQRRYPLWQIRCRDIFQKRLRKWERTGGKGHTAPVGQYPPNPYGLYDMHGNVQEWVSDWYDDYYYNESPPTDPQGPDRGSLKVVRGGCFAMIGSDCRCAARRPHDPNSFTETVGFRVVLAVG